MTNSLIDTNATLKKTREYMKIFKLSLKATTINLDHESIMVNDSKIAFESLNLYCNKSIITCHKDSFNNKTTHFFNDLIHENDQRVVLINKVFTAIKNLSSLTNANILIDLYVYNYAIKQVCLKYDLAYSTIRRRINDSLIELSFLINTVVFSEKF